MKGTLENIAGEEEISHSNMRLFYPDLVSHFYSPGVDITQASTLGLLFFLCLWTSHPLTQFSLSHLYGGTLKLYLGCQFFFLTSILLLLIPVGWSFSLVSPFYHARSGPLSVSLDLNSPTILQLTKNRSSLSCLFPVSHPIRSTN